MRFEKIRTTMLAAALALSACCVASEPAKAAEQPRLPQAESLAIAVKAERDYSTEQHWAFRWVPYAAELALTDIVKCRSFVAMVDATAPEVSGNFRRLIDNAVPGALAGP